MNLFEKKLDDIESKDLKLNLILSGDGVPMESHEENTKRTTIALIKDKLKVIIKSPEIVSATRIGSRPNSQRPNRRPIKIVLQDNEVKNSILSAFKTAKPENLYFNEDLTPKRRSFLYCLRQAKGKFPSLISGTMTRDNKVYVFVKPTGIVTNANQNKSTRIEIGSYQKLMEFFEKTLGIHLMRFVDVTKLNDFTP